MRNKKTNESYNNLPQTPYLIDKNLIFKRSSPNKKNKSKSKIISAHNSLLPSTSSYYNQSLYGRKHRNQQTQTKLSSNQSSTHCSLNRSKKQKNFQLVTKKGKKIRQNTYFQNSNQRSQKLQLKPDQIMLLINSYASKIQRQWRRYWFRKCLRFIIIKERQNKQFQKYRYQDSQPLKWRKQSKNITELNRISQQTQELRHYQKMNVSIQSSQIADSCNNITQGYNNQKYASLQSISSRKCLPNPFNHHELNTQHKIYSKQQRRQMCKVQLDLNEVKNYQKNRAYSKAQINSINRLIFSPQDEKQYSCKNDQNKKRNMKFQCKILDYQIDNCKRQNQTEVNRKNSTQQYANQDKRIKTKYIRQTQIQTSIQNFDKFQQTKLINLQSKLTDDKYPYQKMFKKCKIALQGKKLNKLLSIQSKYSNNQITHRTYQRILKQINDKHQTQIKMIQIRQGSIKNSWNQVYKLYRQNAAKQSSFFQDKSQISQHQLQSSMCFDKWDFESSAKKSISNVQSFQEFAKQLNKRQELQKQAIPKNIQLVLEQLNKKQQQEQILFLKKRANSFQKKSFAHNQELLSGQIKNLQTQQKMRAFKAFKSDLISRKIQQQRQNRNSQIVLPTNYLIQGLSDSIEQNLSTKDQNIKQQKYIIKNTSQIERGSSIMANQNVSSIQESKVDKIKQISAQGVKQQQTKSASTLLDQAKIFFKQSSFNSPKIKEKTKKMLHQYCDRSDTQFNHSYEVDEGLVNAHNQQQSESSQFHSQQNLNIFLNYQKKSPIQISKGYQSPLKQTIDPQTQYQKTKFLQITLIYRELKEKLFATDLREILTYCSKKKKQNKQKVQKQLRKYCSIQPDISAINSWLLQICHFLLDHHMNQIKSNLIHVRMPSQKQLLKLVNQQKQYQKTYDIIPQRLFKEFQFFSIKQLSKNMEIQPQKYQNFSTLVYGFHRCLVDGLNQTLLDELVNGRRWLTLPWLNQFRCQKKIMQDHAKYCLQRAINRVSNWGQYSMGQIQVNKEMSEYQWKQYQQQKMSLIIRQETFQIPLQNEIFLSSVIMKIYQQVFISQMRLAAGQLFAINY